MLSHDQMLSKRKVYSLLDMIGDIGGLHDGLIFFVGFLVSFYNNCMFDLELVKSLFKFQKTPIKSTAKVQRVSNSDFIQITKNIER